MVIPNVIYFWWIVDLQTLSFMEAAALKISHHALNSIELFLFCQMKLFCLFEQAAWTEEYYSV